MSQPEHEAIQPDPFVADRGVARAAGARAGASPRPSPAGAAAAQPGAAVAALVAGARAGCLAVALAACARRRARDVRQEGARRAGRARGRAERRCRPGAASFTGPRRSDSEEARKPHRPGAAGGTGLPTTPGRAQLYESELTLKVKSLSAATKRALRLTRSFNGYVRSVEYGSGTERGSAYLVAPRAGRQRPGCDRPLLRAGRDPRPARLDPGRPAAARQALPRDAGAA